MKLLNYFLLNLIFIRFYFFLEESRNEQASYQYFENIRNDLEKIGFNNEVNLTYSFFAILFSVVITLLSFNILKKSLDFSKLKNLQNFFLKLFSLNSVMLLGFLYFLRAYNFSRFYLMICLLIYPFIIFTFNYLLNRNKFSSYFLIIVL